MVSGAGVSSVPSTSAAFRASLSASSNPTASSAASRQARHRDTNRVRARRAQQGTHQIRCPLDPDHVRARQQRRRVHHVRPVSRPGQPLTPGKARRSRYVPAPALPAHHPIFSHRQRGRGDIEDLHGGSNPPSSAARSAPHPPHVPGSMTRVSSGWAAHARLAPGCPFCPPCGPPRPAARLAVFAPRRRAVPAGRLRGIRGIPARLPPQRRDLGPQRLNQCRLLRHHRQQLRLRRSATASSSYEGCSGQGIPEPNHDHKLDASTDTPQINRRPDWLRLRQLCRAIMQPVLRLLILMYVLGMSRALDGRQPARVL